ncbi:unnamed protein product [Heterobilharzia americana]|nr:unnamed protein product [Heterobilharzia americana]
MKILPTYFVLVCTILTAFSVNGRLEPPEFELPEYPHGHMRHPIDRIPTRNVNYKMPQYDDQLPDFPKEGKLLSSTLAENFYQIV